MHERIVTAVRNDGLGKKLKDVLIACYDQIVRRCCRLIRETHRGVWKTLTIINRVLQATALAETRRAAL